MEPKSVAIVGSGAVAWLTAAALKRAFKHCGLDVVVVEHDGGPSPRARSSLPSLRALHALIGLDENKLVRETGATFKLGTEHIGWSGDSSSFLHIHGDIGAPIGAAQFYQYLIQEALAGREDSPEKYSLAAIAARNGRFARPKNDPRSPFGTYTYGYHLDEARYVAHLRAHATAFGVRREAHAAADVAIAQDGSIQALILEGDEQVGADCFVDCSGADAFLMSRLSPDFEDWSHALPCDRIATAAASPIDNPPPLTQTSAAQAGWLRRVPLQDWTLLGYVYSSAFLSDDDAVCELKKAFGLPSNAGIEVSRFKAGQRTAFWRKNCVAVGEAAIVLEPLASTDLHLAHAGISNLISLFPLDPHNPIEAAEYNRLMAEHACGARDFVLAHYRAGPSRGGDFWSAVKSAPLPERLAHKLDLYAAAGKIGLLDHETFEETDWAWLFLGRQFIPDALEPQAPMILKQAPPWGAAKLAESLSKAALSLPPHKEYLERLCALAEPTNHAER